MTHTTVPTFLCGFGDQTQVLMFTQQVLSQLNHFLSPRRLLSVIFFSLQSLIRPLASRSLFFDFVLRACQPSFGNAQIIWVPEGEPTNLWQVCFLNRGTVIFLGNSEVSLLFYHGHDAPRALPSPCHSPGHSAVALILQPSLACWLYHPKHLDWLLIQNLIDPLPFLLIPEVSSLCWENIPAKRGDWHWVTILPWLFGQAADSSRAW